MQKELDKTKNTDKNKIPVDLIKNELKKRKNNIDKMSKNKKEIEKPYGIVDIVEKILDFNNQLQSKCLVYYQLISLN